MRRTQRLFRFLAPPSRPVWPLHRPRLAVGFTVIELMVVIALGALLITLAEPSMVSLVQSNRVATQAAQLSNALREARAEAQKRGLPVVMCLSSAGSACDTSGTDWAKGWITYVDTDGDGSLDTDESVVRKQGAGANAGTASSSVSQIAFSRDGFGLNLGGTVVWTLSNTSGGTTVSRCVSLSIVGQITESAPSQGTCS
jgi:type IV fimbrial biogenesis protein FimT